MGQTTLYEYGVIANLSYRDKNSSHVLTSFKTPDQKGESVEGEEAIIPELSSDAGPELSEL